MSKTFAGLVQNKKDSTIYVIAAKAEDEESACSRLEAIAKKINMFFVVALGGPPVYEVLPAPKPEPNRLQDAGAEPFILELPAESPDPRAEEKQNADIGWLSKQTMPHAKPDGGIG